MAYLTIQRMSWLQDGAEQRAQRRTPLELQSHLPNNYGAVLV